MTNGFSAGPWRFDEDVSGPDTCIVADDSRLPNHEIHVICFGHDYDDYGRFDLPHVRRNIRTEKEAKVERDANKRLILKATEMFDQLHRMVYRDGVSLQEIRELLSWIETGGADLEGSRDD